MNAAERHPVTFSDGSDGLILPEGTRVRSRQHPELTGYIKHYEWNKAFRRGDDANVLSSVPYCIGWDDSARAADLLGWFFVYASDDGVEPVE